MSDHLKRELQMIVNTMWLLEIESGTSATTLKAQTTHLCFMCESDSLIIQVVFLDLAEIWKNFSSYNAKNLIKRLSLLLQLFYWVFT